MSVRKKDMCGRVDLVFAHPIAGALGFKILSNAVVCVNVIAHPYTRQFASLLATVYIYLKFSTEYPGIWVMMFDQLAHLIG